VDPETINNLIKKYALHNAYKHNGKVDGGAVISKLMGEYPELRPVVKDILKALPNVIEGVNNLTLQEQQKLLESLAPELLNQVVSDEKKEKLPELPNHKNIIMRFAPNPNGPPTLGSARGIVINSEYTQMYSGTFILRFDDTDPQTKRPMLEAYDWYIEDCEWLQTRPDLVVIASDRMAIYYSYAEKLVKLGAAYVCTCTQEEFKRFKDAMIPCPDRDRTADENLKLWNDMLRGFFREKEAVLRIKTDIKHKNPALRDWICFRIISAPHPRGLEYRVWPMLDFESAIEDHLLNVTHILRGKDLRDSEGRQQFLYNYLGWQYPITIHWGRISIYEFGKFSTSEIKKAIEKGVYRGWDDPKLPTIRALRRRGFHPEALRRFMISLGVSESDIRISLENLYAENRKVIDVSTHRYFFVKDPVRMDIVGVAPTTARPPLHPSLKLGFRELKVGSEVFISSDDIKFALGDIIRLKDLYNVKIARLEPLVAEYSGDERTRRLKIVHWVPTNGLKVEVLTPEGIDDGIGEQGIASELNNVVQFERYGFVRIDEIIKHDSETKIIAYFTHQ
jgi:glutamyl-tRNA synthetase